MLYLDIRTTVLVIQAQVACISKHTLLQDYDHNITGRDLSLPSDLQLCVRVAQLSWP